MKKAIFIKGKEYSDVKNIYNDGGELEIKIKDRLGKASFELPIECIVYVPSTKDANAIIPKNEMQQRVKEVQKFLSNIFGGYSSANVDGGYVSSDKGLIQEDVVKVTAFATKDAIQKNMPKLVKRIQQWCNQWSQESIGFEFEGDLFYISATSKFMNGGKTKFGGGGTAEEQNRHMILSQAKEVAHHVKELNEILSKQPNIDSWVVAKMQDVTTGLSDITHYLDGKSEFRLGGENIQTVQDSMLARGAKLKSGKLTLSKIKDVLQQVNKQGYQLELKGALDDIRIVDVKSGKTTFEGSKEEVYNYLVQAKYISKFVDGGMDNFYSLQGMTNDEIIKFANELSFYDRMDEGIEEEFTEIEDAKDYLRLMEYEI